MTRISPPAAAGFALFVSILAAQLLPFMDHSSTTATAQASPAIHSDLLLQVLLPLAVMEAALLAAASYANRHVAGGAGAANNRRLSVSELAAFISCVAVGLLQFFLFVLQPAGGVVEDGGAPARALGLAALRALTASATATTFLLGVALVYAHVGAGGGNGPVPEVAVRILAEITLEAAAATLVCIMAMAIYTL